MDLKLGLPDVLPPNKPVEISVGTVIVTGFGSDGLVAMINRFPAAQKLFDKSSRAELLMNINVASIMALAEPVLNAFIACGMGVPNDVEQEARICRLVIGDKATLVAEILKVSLPRGIRPFEEIMELFGLLDEHRPPAKLNGAGSPPTSPVPSSSSPEGAASPQA